MESRNFTSFDALGTPVFPNKFLDISQKSLPQSQLNQFWLEENRDFPFNWNNRVDFLQFTRQSQEFDFSLLTDEVSSLITTRNIEIVVFPQGDLSSEDFENQLKLDCQKHFQEKTSMCLDLLAYFYNFF